MNYGGLPDEFSQESSSKIVILPVPYDGTSTWIKGADKGPEAILDASANMELFDIETDTEVYRHGIFTAPPVLEKNSPELMTKELEKRAKAYLNNEKFLITIGGEHSVTAGAVFAQAKKVDSLSVLQLDAHTDLRPEYEGSRFNHACVMSRVGEVCPFVQVGIRSMDVEEKQYVDPARTVFADQIGRERNWESRVLNNLTEKVYITIDLDVFDPAFMPSTGTPEPGGMDWYTVLELLKKVSQNREVVGFDVVELCPNDHNKAPDFLASKLIYKLLSYVFVNRK